MTDNTIQLIRFSDRTGLCPVCRDKPSGIYPDGTKHITCGDKYCFYMWLTRRPPMPAEKLRQIRARELNEI